MNYDVKNLYETIKILVNRNALEDEFKACIDNISDNSNAKITVAQLNEYLRESISYGSLFCRTYR